MRLAPSQLLFVTGSELRFQIEHFSTISAASRNILMHIQGFYFGKLFGFFCGLLGTEVAVGPFDRLCLDEGQRHVSNR